MKRTDKSDVLRDLVPFVQFKKREKHPWRNVTFNKVADLNFTKSDIPPWVFFTFFKLYKWYQITHYISNLLWIPHKTFSILEELFSSSIFMKLPVFKFLLVDHIWSLLLLQTIFPEVQVLMLLYSIVDHLYGCFSYCRGLFQQVQDSIYDLTFKLWFNVVFFRMFHDK